MFFKKKKKKTNNNTKKTFQINELTTWIVTAWIFNLKKWRKIRKSSGQYVVGNYKLEQYQTNMLISAFEKNQSAWNVISKSF